MKIEPPSEITIFKIQPPLPLQPLLDQVSFATLGH